MFVEYSKMSSFSILFISIIWVKFVHADDVLGCNGFVKSDLNIDLSKVFVKLFTKQGSLKDQTECAPTNGYYFLPLYDKGDYIIKVSTPTGWSFDPPEVAIYVDGVNDPCSQGKDINFVFNGFAISGKVVSRGSGVGPPGVKVELFEETKLSGAPFKSTVTSEGGAFLFSPVKPGNYLVKASHPRWLLSLSEAKVSVKDSNGEVPFGRLVIAGYDVAGTVTSDNHPISGVSFVLFAKTKNKVEIGGCESGPLEGFTSSLADFILLCHVSSDAQGHFSFLTVPPGVYAIVPHYKGAGAKFNILPTKLEFTVVHSSLTLPTVFQVQGFSVSGKVLWAEGEDPMPDVKVFLKGAHVATTDKQGVYTLDSMRANTYRLQFKGEGVLFDDVDMKVTGRLVGDVIPSRFKVTGKLSAGGHKVNIIGPNNLSLNIPTDAEGRYSHYLARGQYTFSALPLGTDKDNSLQFSPKEVKVEVKNKVINGIDFSQLRSTVQGKITCMGSCSDIIVKLKSKGSLNTLQTALKGGEYIFSDVLPGEYDMFVEGSQGWCWEKETQTVSVTSEYTQGPTFVQSGFTLSIVSSHSTKVLYKREDGKGVEGEVSVGVGGTQVCLPSSGPYILQPSGCHRYKDQQFHWTPGSPPVKLMAVTHAYTFSLVTSHVPQDLHMVAASTDNPSQQPLKLNVEGRKEENKLHKLIYSVQLSEGASIQLTPQSSLLLFAPLTAQITGDNDCTDTSSHPLFTAEQGQILKGRVTSSNNIGVGGVIIKVVYPDETVVATVETVSDGTYTSPPVRNFPGYKILAEKEGYLLSGPDKQGNISAHKLAEIIVKVTDKADSSPLQGVLLSLSGGERYRRNAQTSDEGTLSFVSLSPGEYFLKPMMKEYKFTPGSQTITVSEGATQHINLTGVRVAYSGFGVVISLNGDEEPGVIVEAVGIGHCHLLQEEATSGPNGQFRIRGLQSGCEYNVRVKQGPEINQHIFKSSPDKIPVKVQGKDVEGLELYAFRSLGKTDIVVHVSVDRPEDMKTLKVKLTREDAPDHVISSVKLSEYRPTVDFALPSVIVSLPAVASDGTQYLVSLESSLARTTHDYALRAVRVTADMALRVARLSFTPTPRMREPEPAHTSYLALPFILLTLLAYHYRSALASLISALLQAKLEDSSPSQSFSDSKRKTKLRKIQ